MKKVLAGMLGAAFAFLVFAGTAAADPKGEKLFQDMAKAWSGIKDYTCKFSYEEDKGGSMSGGTYDYKFKKPYIVRLEGVDGENKGTIVVYRPDQDGDFVHVKKGILPLKLKKTNGMVKDFFKSDLGFDIKYAQEFVKSSGASITLKSPGSVKGRSAEVLELTAKKSGEFSKVVVYVDKATKMPIQIDRYKGSKPFSHRLYWDLKVNTNFSSNDVKF